MAYEMLISDWSSDVCSSDLNGVTASSIGNPALAVNNLLGSSAINILLLAIADAIVGRRAVTSIVAQPSTMMMATLCMIILMTIAVLVVLGDVLFGPIGIGSRSEEHTSELQSLMRISYAVVCLEKTKIYRTHLLN